MSIINQAQKFRVKVTGEPIGGEDGERSFLGRSDEATNTIVIDGTMPRSRQEEVLLHELIHIIGPDIPEMVVRTLGVSLYGILRENGLLVANLISKVSDGTITRVEAEQLNQDSNEMAKGPVFVLGRSTSKAHRVTDKPWDGSASQYDIDQWKRATLIHLDDVDPDMKSSHKLPVREPNGDLNRNGCHAAAAVLGGGRGGVDAPMAKKQAAARALVRIYRQELQEDPPESMMQMAGM